MNTAQIYHQHILVKISETFRNFTYWYTFLVCCLINDVFRKYLKKNTAQKLDFCLFDDPFAYFRVRQATATGFDCYDNDIVHAQCETEH